MEEALKDFAGKELLVLPKKRPGKLFGILFLLLALFFTFYNPNLDVPKVLKTSAVGAPAPLKAPAIEAGQGVKFIARTQGIFKFTTGSDDHPSSKLKYVNAFKSGKWPAQITTACEKSQVFHCRHSQTLEILPRAPPTNLT